MSKRRRTGDAVFSSGFVPYNGLSSRASVAGAVFPSQIYNPVRGASGDITGPFDVEGVLTCGSMDCLGTMTAGSVVFGGLSCTSLTDTGTLSVQGSSSLDNGTITTDGAGDLSVGGLSATGAVTLSSANIRLAGTSTTQQIWTAQGAAGQGAWQSSIDLSGLSPGTLTVGTHSMTGGDLFAGTTGAHSIHLGNTSAVVTTAIDGFVNVGTANSSETIAIGTGGLRTVLIGGSTGPCTTSINGIFNAGTGSSTNAISIGTGGARTISIGNTTGPSSTSISGALTAGTNTDTSTISIGTAGARAVTVGGSSATLTTVNGAAVQIGNILVPTTTTVRGVFNSPGLGTPTTGCLILGTSAGGSGMSGTANTILGVGAAASLTTGGGNTIVGDGSGTALTTGGGNVYIGDFTGTVVSTGLNNVAIGHQAGASADISASIMLGSGATTATSNVCVIGGNVFNRRITDLSSGIANTCALGSAFPFTTISLSNVATGTGVMGYTELKAIANTTINGMSTTPLLVLAAPGAGKVFIVERLRVTIHFGSAVFTGGGAIHLQYGVASGLTAATAGINASLFNSVSEDQWSEVTGVTGTVVTSALSANLPLYLTNDGGNFSVGTGCTVDARVWYRIENV